MDKIIFAALCSSLLAATTLQAAAAPRHAPKPVRTSPLTTEPVRNARASYAVMPETDANGLARGNAGAAPAGR